MTRRDNILFNILFKNIGLKCILYYFFLLLGIIINLNIL